MTVPIKPLSPSDLAAYCKQLAHSARSAAQVLSTARGGLKDRWLHEVATLLAARQEDLLAANQRDLETALRLGLADAALERLRLTPQRLEAAATGLHEVAALPDPIGRVRDSNVRPNGLQVLKVGVPLGVIFFIYESRPNVTLDLRGGKEAAHSNAVLCAILRNCLAKVGLPEDAVQLVDTADRAAVGHLLKLDTFIDLVIPRGGEELIRRVAEEARMPVLKHYKGNCHVYVDRSADPAMAERIVVNAKCQRPGVCNAAESLLVHRDVAAVLLPRLCTALQQRGVELRGCGRTRELVPGVLPATAEDFAAEYLDLIMSVAVVDDLEAAIAHINQYGSRHSDAIITNEFAAAQRFTAAVDSAAVFVNASTRFNDGYEFGLGAEIGISTDKCHARGPCGLVELTSYKYIVLGDGQVRE